MNAHTLTKEFAKGSGYGGNCPAMLKAFEAIRQAGIREARKAHHERMKVVEQYAEYPALFFFASKALTTDEAVTENRRIIAQYRRLPTWQQQTRGKQLVEAKLMLVIARYFRRFGKRVWQKEAA